MIKQANETINQELAAVFAGKAVSSVMIAPADQTTLSELANKKVFAFAGIGYPQKFYDTLESLSVKVCKTANFPDHHQYTEDDLNKILSLAKDVDADAIFTTEKDFVKIPDKFKERISYLPIHAVWDNPQFINSLLSKLTETT